VANLFANPERSLKWLGQPEAKDYLEWVAMMAENYESKLRSGSEPFVVYRAQGALDVLKKILELREDLLRMSKPGGITLEPSTKEKR
jgi:hypothetical protein